MIIGLKLPPEMRAKLEAIAARSTSLNYRKVPMSFADACLVCLVEN